MVIPHRSGTAANLCMIFMLLLTPHVVRADPDGSPLGEILESVLADLSSVGVLGSTLAIDIPGRKPLFLAAGHADKEQKVPTDVSRLYQIGSQTKMFTAASVLLLEREGKLSLDDKVATYVSGITGSPDVTIEQLLTHTGGIGDSITLFDPPAVRPDYHVSLDDHLLLGRVSGKQFEAGERWHYNNLGFVVLGRVVEVVRTTLPGSPRAMGAAIPRDAAWVSTTPPAGLGSGA